jgi:hypothetical protein
MSTLPRHASLWIALVVWGGVLAAAAPEPPGKALPAPLGINAPLAKEQLKVIDQIIADLDRLLRGGEIGATDPGFILWSRRRVDALRASGASKAELNAALDQHLVRTKNREAWVKIQYTKDATGSRMDVLAAQYDRLQAEMWLNQEQAR